MLTYQVCGPVAGLAYGSAAPLEPTADSLPIAFDLPDGTGVHLRAASGAEATLRVKGGRVTVPRRLFDGEGDAVSVTVYPKDGEAVHATSLVRTGSRVTGLPTGTAAGLSDLWRALLDLQRRMGNVREDCEELAGRVEDVLPRLNALWERAADGDILL